MKTKLYQLLAMFCLAITLLSLPVSAFADSGISNRIIGDADSQTGVMASVPGPDLIRTTGDQGKIVMPRYQDYYEHPVVRFVDAPKNHSIYVYKDPNIDLSRDVDQEDMMPYAHEGMKVQVVAEQNSMRCIIYSDRNYQQHAGWVETRHLSERFPGKETIIGYASATDSTQAEVPLMSWSKEPFVGTNQKFVMFSDSVRNCTKMQLAYQVTNVYDCRFEDTLGTRTVYINDGSGWVEAGQFEYDAQGTVLATVNLREPMDLKAVAVIPSCNEPDRFLYRIEIQGLGVA